MWSLNIQRNFPSVSCLPFQVRTITHDEPICRNINYLNFNLKSTIMEYLKYFMVELETYKGKYSNIDMRRKGKSKKSEAYVLSCDVIIHPKRKKERCNFSFRFFFF